jgi:hypothetical protein
MMLLILMLTVLGPVFASQPSLGAEGYTELVEYSEAEKKEACRLYEKRYLAYVDRIYYVENCQFREVTEQELIEQLVAKKTPFVDIEHTVLAKLKRGEPLTLAGNKPLRSCQSLSGRYVTFDFEQYFLSENCVLKLFPDIESFYIHRSKNNRIREEVVAVSLQEFRSFKKRERLPTALKEDMDNLYPQTAHVDIIDRDKACEGINGLDVFYVDLIYRIENCRKRQYDAEAYSFKHPHAKLKEMTSEQWISLPDGPAMP